jgi:hypothetical protein
MGHCFMKLGNQDKARYVCWTEFSLVLE